MACNCDQSENYARCIKVLKSDNPSAASKLATMQPEDMMAAVAMHASEQVAAWSQEGTEPFFKPRPFKGDFACYVLIEFQYANSHYACSLISDPALRAECEMKAMESYCEAHMLCGGGVE